ncbi:MAG: efflux transporter outer membrane subunit [Burkholderiales bacterium]
MKPVNQIFHAAVVALVVVLTGCAVGPDYKRPAVPTPQSFTVPSGWKVAEPHDAEIPADWWKMFNDPVLADYEQKVSQSNQTLAQREAALRQARALVQIAQAGLFPTLNAAAGTTRNRASAGAIGLAQGKIYDNYLLAAQASWEPDLWGSVRRSIEANTASMQASAGQLAASRLSLQSQLAVDYFQLRADDAQKKMLTDTVDAYQKYLDLTRNRFDQGVAAQTDVLQAEGQLRSTEALLLDVGIQRAQLEHAIAVLTGTPTSEFHIPELPLGTDIPHIPLTVPSVLLERRPDVASAERSAAAASAQIGVAKAAFFPALSINGALGFQNSAYNNLVNQPNSMWSLSPQFLLPIFNAGLLAAGVDQAVAAYDQSVANYREVVLEAFQNVEDNLVAAAILAHEITVQNEAVRAARSTLTLTDSQYREGIVNYLNVITAQTTLLTNELTELNLRSRQYAASVQLIVALGGGWDDTQ